MLVTTSEFRSQQAKMLGLADKGENVIIHRRNKPSYMLVKVEIEENVVLSPEAEKMIAKSRQEYREGKVKSFNSSTDAQAWLESL